MEEEGGCDVVSLSGGPDENEPTKTESWCTRWDDVCKCCGTVDGNVEEVNAGTHPK